MGEIANDVIEGFLCQQCLQIMPDHSSPGYPRTCKECGRGTAKATFISYKVPCPICGKKVKQLGLAQHTQDMHCPPNKENSNGSISVSY